jgi:hypothetical protein
MTWAELGVPGRGGHDGDGGAAHHRRAAEHVPVAVVRARVLLFSVGSDSPVSAASLGKRSLALTSRSAGRRELVLAVAAEALGWVPSPACAR